MPANLRDELRKLIETWRSKLAAYDGGANVLSCDEAGQMSACLDEVEALLSSSSPETPGDARAEVIERALMAARSFIRNGVAFGFIRMPDPDTPDPAHNTPRLIDEALALLRKDGR